jgi:hypothetical protein
VWGCELHSSGPVVALVNVASYIRIKCGDILTSYATTSLLRTDVIHSVVDVTFSKVPNRIFLLDVCEETVIVKLYYFRMKCPDSWTIAPTGMQTPYSLGSCRCL